MTCFPGYKYPAESLLLRFPLFDVLFFLSLLLALPGEITLTARGCNPQREKSRSAQVCRCWLGLLSLALVALVAASSITFLLKKTWCFLGCKYHWSMKHTEIYYFLKTLRPIRSRCWEKWKRVFVKKLGWLIGECLKTWCWCFFHWHWSRFLTIS